MLFYNLLLSPLCVALYRAKMFTVGETFRHLLLAVDLTSSLLHSNR